MNEVPRFVLDTNVFVSSIILQNLTAHLALIRAIRFGKLLVSQDTLEELLDPFRGIPILTPRAFLERTW